VTICIEVFIMANGGGGNVFSYTRGVAVSVSSTDMSLNIDEGFPHARGFYIGTAGSLAIQTTGGDTLTFPAVSGWIAVEAVKVFKSGTSASGIVALF